VTTAAVAGRGTTLLDLAGMGWETVGFADQNHIAAGTEFIALELTTCLELSVDPWHLKLGGDR
jgi:hypothetical protein